jgi:hypothetical protein
LNEKRQFPRVEINSTVLIAAVERAWLCQLQDISNGGARVAKPLDWVQLSPGLRLHFILDQDTIISLYAQLVRDAGDHLGLRFDAGQDDEVDRLMYESRFVLD